MVLPRLARATVRVLRETTAPMATVEPSTLRQRVDHELESCPERLELSLLPFVVASIDGLAE